MTGYPSKVLLATDGTEDSVRAARVAVALVASSGGELHLIHVGQPATSSTGTTVEGASLPGPPPQYAEKQARKLLDRQIEGVRMAGGNVAEGHLRIGRPAAEVVALAAQIGADLVVVGSGGPSPVRRAVSATIRRPALGRASDLIVRSAPCPVLVVRGDHILTPGAADPIPGTR